MENQSLLWKIADVSVFFVAKSDVTGLFSWNFPIANGVYHSSGRFFSLTWQGKPRWHLHRWQVAALRSGAETGPRLTVTYRANSAVFGGNHLDICAAKLGGGILVATCFFGPTGFWPGTSGCKRFRMWATMMPIKNVKWLILSILSPPIWNCCLAPQP